MYGVKYFENNLNVEYVHEFIEKVQADDYLQQLMTLPFYTPTLKIRGRNAKPKRQLLAYGDSGTSYAFSGTCIRGEPWTPLMLELRQLVENYVGYTFNFVLLNLYADGNSYISPHKDDESGLDHTFPVVVLSFGEKRTLEFKRPNYPPTTICLEHGSLYSMMSPTNELFTHGIAPEPALKNTRISLTFRHLVTSVSSPHKKQKLNNVDSTSIQNESLQQDLLAQNDWMVKHIQSVDSSNPILRKWPLNWNTFAEIVLDKNSTLRLHLRNFYESSDGQLFPTKQAVIMTCATFSYFEDQIINFNFQSVSDSFISNNQLLVAFDDGEFCYLQQIFQAKPHGFYFKLGGLRLSKDQVSKLIESLPEIRECLIESLFLKVIPNLILNKPPMCIDHRTLDQTKNVFLTCLENEIGLNINKFISCEGCKTNNASQVNHSCMMHSLSDKFILTRNKSLLNMNVFEIVKKLYSEITCTCHITEDFFRMFDSTFVKDYLLEKF